MEGKTQQVTAEEALTESEKRFKPLEGFIKESLEGKLDDQHVTVRVKFDAANAPVLKVPYADFKADVMVIQVYEKLKEKLGVSPLVLVVDQCFVPLPDQTVGQLFANFGRNGVLHITYGVQAVFG